MDKKKKKHYSSIQFSHAGLTILKKKKRDDETYEEYFRRIGAI